MTPLAHCRQDKGDGTGPLVQYCRPHQHHFQLPSSCAIQPPSPQCASSTTMRARRPPRCSWTADRKMQQSLTERHARICRRLTLTSTTNHTYISPHWQYKSRTTVLSPPHLVQHAQQRIALGHLLRRHKQHLDVGGGIADPKPGKGGAAKVEGSEKHRMTGSIRICGADGGCSV